MEQHDPQLSQAYREAEHPAPPAALDARILAEARKAVAPPRRRPTWLGWAVPLSTTAVLVLGVGLLFRMHLDAPETLHEAAPPPAVVSPDTPPETPLEAPPAMLSEASPRQRGSARPAPLPLDSRPSPLPAAADTVAALPERGIASEAAAIAPAAIAPQRAPGNAVPAEAAQALPAMPAASPARLERAPGFPVMQGLNPRKAQSRLDSAPAAVAESGVEAWVERIRDLLRQGRAEEARKALADLRERYPAYPLPEDLEPYAR